MCGRKAAIHVSGQKIGAEHDASVLDRVVLIQQPGADDRALFVDIGIREQCIEPPFFPERVVVQENDVLA
jgi:hypothetical protein